MVLADRKYNCQWEPYYEARVGLTLIFPDESGQMIVPEVSNQRTDTIIIGWAMSWLEAINESKVEWSSTPQHALERLIGTVWNAKR